MPRRGKYKIILTDGSETVHQGKPSLDEIRRLIGCDTLDTVTIDRAQTDGARACWTRSR